MIPEDFYEINKVTVEREKGLRKYCQGCRGERASGLAVLHGDGSNIDVSLPPGPGRVIISHM